MNDVNWQDANTPTKRLPEGWQWVRLGDAADLVNGDAFRPTDWSSSGLPIIRIQNLNDATKPFNYWSGRPTNRVLVKAGDLLLAWSGTPGTSFGAHVWRGDLGVLNQHIFRVDLRGDAICEEWAQIAINHQLDVLIQKAHGGVGLRHVTKAEVESLQIPVPPIEEQGRIAAALKGQVAAVGRARVASEARLEATKALRAAYLRRTCCGVVPLSVGSERCAPPSGWKWRRLTTVARLESGHTPSRYHPEWWGGTIPWIALPDIRMLDGKVAYETTEYTNKAGIANSSARVLPAGTVVLSRTASVGFVTMMGREMATSQDFVNWVCGPELDPRFLLYLLMASREYIRSLASGAVHKTVYVPTVRAFEVCVPSLDVQRSISAFLNGRLAESESLQASIESELAAINALPAALLRRAFSGAL